MNKLLDLRSDVDEPAPIRDFEPKMFSKRSQRTEYLRNA
jgi:hypothetical protein